MTITPSISDGLKKSYGNTQIDVIPKVAKRANVIFALARESRTMAPGIQSVFRECVLVNPSKRKNTKVSYVIRECFRL